AVSESRGTQQRGKQSVLRDARFRPGNVGRARSEWGGNAAPGISRRIERRNRDGAHLADLRPAGVRNQLAGHSCGRRDAVRHLGDRSMIRAGSSRNRIAVRMRLAAAVALVFLSMQQTPAFAVESVTITLKESAVVATDTIHIGTVADIECSSAALR